MLNSLYSLFYAWKRSLGIVVPNFELSPYLTVLPEYCGLGLGLMKKRAVAELTVMTSMRARVSMVRGCMLLAGHHPPHWCRCHHLTCDMSCVGPGPGTQGERCCCLSIHCTSIMCHCARLCSAVLCHLTMQGGKHHSKIFTKASCLKLKD